ncbi:pheromone shutdown-related protein TraB [Allochromatium warmingii]|uniref:Pheromone shutdown-related protein TraB n=1 Tax=Allochromatium warmingii TaxID=61595 RepID=A0A1H3CYQ1_ALLWA|nr:TraB/GumN family protein [Allochromatium warmingii]SDX59206.1 pheromone shutdown-related protein TraB [Allochromatium warmingii]
MVDAIEPRRDLVIDGVELTLLGTAHISRASAEQVHKLIQSGDYDGVAVELCRSRFNALMDPRTLAQMDLFSVIRQNRVYMVAANLVLAAYQQRLADQFGIEPGAEQRVALRLTKEQNLPLLLIDREIGITLKRIAANLGWWKRAGLFAGLLSAMLSSETVTEDEIERLKEGDVLETAFAELAADRRDLYVPLIEERDRYIAAKLKREVARVGAQRVLVVLGAGHLKGVTAALEHERGDPTAVLTELEQVPPPSRWSQVLTWTLLLVILAGFAYGFAVSPELGLDLLLSWALITGGLSALGTLLAAGHPLTVLAALFAAPLTTLNPAIGAGMITGAVELYLRKPSVGDFSRLRADVATWSGWWRNRVSRVLVVFVLSSLGAGLGTYFASLQLIKQLLGAELP